MTAAEIVDRMVEDARGTGMSPLVKLEKDWADGQAERDANRALCNAHFDAVRDRALAERDAREMGQ